MNLLAACSGRGRQQPAGSSEARRLRPPGMPELQEVPCGVTPRATPHELQLIVRVNFEQQNVIAGCEAPALVMNKPFVAMYSRENEASAGQPSVDRKSTRLNSSHVSISYAVFCLKKK